MIAHQAVSRSARLVGVGLALAALLCLATNALAWVDPSLTSALGLQAAAQARPAYDPGTVTVKFRDSVGRARIDEVAASLGGKVTYVSEFTRGLRVISIPAGRDVGQMVNSYRRRADVQYAEPTYLDYPAMTPNDPMYSQQWNFPLIHVPRAWNKVGGGSSSIVVCVLDTGVAFEDYSGFLVAPDLDGATFVSPKDAVDGDTHPNDEVGHGTHVTGTIAQRTNNALGVAGVAFNVSIMPVRSLGPDGGSHPQMSDGVHWATDHGAKIINYSAGGSDSRTKHNAVIYAYDNGVLFIAAYGNDGAENPPTGYPGQYPECLGVGAVDRNKALAYYSNWGDGVDVVAPGGDTSGGEANGIIQNTFEASPTDFGYFGWMGTSMATPHVSGLAALIWSQNNFHTRQGVFDRLTSTCEDLGDPGYDTTFGWGLIQAGHAVPPPRPPTLSWVGNPGYLTDGVNPNAGPVGTTFVFRVKYQDSFGVPPNFARLQVNRDGALFGSVALTPLPGGDLTTGMIYRGKLVINQTGSYQYRFRFEHGTGWATGPPAAWTAGPTITP